MTFSSLGMRVVIWAPWSVSTVITGARLVVRGRVFALGVEGYLMALAWACYTASVSLIEAAFDLVDQSHLHFAGHIAGVFGLTFLKLAAAATLFRLIPKVNRRRWQLFLFTTSIGVITLSMCVLLASITASCQNSARPNLSTCLTSDAGLQRSFVIAWSTYGALIDFSYTVLGVYLVTKARSTRGKIVSLCLILVLGLVASPCSVLQGFATYDDLYLLYVSLETSLVSICISAPALMLSLGSFAYQNPSDAAHVQDRAVEMGGPPRPDDKRTLIGHGPIRVQTAHDVFTTSSMSRVTSPSYEATCYSVPVRQRDRL